MAKGDHSRVGTSINEQGQNAQAGLNAVNARNNLLYNNMNNNYGYGVSTNLNDYNNIMNNYHNFLNGASNYDLGGALGTYGDFAQTGGFTPQNIQDIRARMIAPIRGVYSQAQANVDRQRALQHGFSPNYTAATAKMARDQAYSTSDAATNAEAAIAQLIQQGRLAGAQGLAGTSLGARGQDVNALAGQTGAYSATPGLASTFGNQVLNAGNQGLQGQELQNQIAEMIIKGRLGEAGVPGDFQTALGNIGGILNLAGTAASMFDPVASLFSKPAMGPVKDWTTGQYS